MNTGHDWFGWMCRKCGTTADRPEANAACKGGVISASVHLSPEIPQRFTLVRETRQGGHYGEEQYEHVSMEPSPMGEWVKYEPLWDGREQLSPFRLSPEGQEKKP